MMLPNKQKDLAEKALALKIGNEQKRATKVMSIPGGEGFDKADKKRARDDHDDDSRVRDDKRGGGDKRGRRSRVGPMRLFGGRLLNTPALAIEIWGDATPSRISKIHAWTRKKNGLPYTRMPSTDSRRAGQDKLFDPEVALKWITGALEAEAEAQNSNERPQRGVGARVTKGA